MTPVTPALAPKLSPLALAIVAALRASKGKWEPRAPGGWNIDDIRLEMGRVFEDENDVYEALDELIARKIVRFTGHDESLAYTSCFEAVS